MSTNILDAIVQLRRAAARAAAVTFTGDLSARQGAILRELRVSGPVSQIVLARATASDPAFVARMLERFERRGLVSRRRSKTDRRQMSVSLTARGKKALGPVDVAYERLMRVAQESLSRDERRTFVRLATKVGASLETVASQGASGSESSDE